MGEVTVPTHFAWSFVSAPATATAAANSAIPHIRFNIARISCTLVNLRAAAHFDDHRTLGHSVDPCVIWITVY